MKATWALFGIVLLLPLCLIRCVPSGANEPNVVGEAKFSAPTTNDSISNADSTFCYLMKAIASQNSTWVASWKKDEDLVCSNFIFKWKKQWKPKWESYSKIAKYVDKYSPYFINCQDTLAIDMYSSNMIVEKRGKELLVDFDVDAKSFIVAPKMQQRALLTSTSDYEIIDKCECLDGDSIVFMGYVKSSDEGKKPFIWTIDIHNDEQFFYLYDHEIIAQRNNFFIVKYPNAHIR